MRTARISLFVALLLACAHRAEQPVPPGPQAVIMWGVSQFFWGDELLVVDRDGQARYDFVPAQRNKRASPVHKASRLSASELDAARAELAAHHVCQLRSKRDGIPDEGQPTLRVNLRDLSCEVSLWDGEWRDDPDARACADAIMHIRERVAHKD